MKAEDVDARTQTDQSTDSLTASTELKLFAVHYDGSEDFVEAVTMRDAITVWHIHMKLQNGSDWYGDEEPEACRLVSEKPVLRTFKHQ